MSLFSDLSALSDQKRSIIEALQSGIGEQIEDVLDELTDLLDTYLAEGKNGLSLSELASVNQLEELIDIVQAAGLDVIEDEIVAKVRSVSSIIEKQLDVAGLTAGQTTLDETALEAYVRFKVRDVTDSFSIDAAKSIQKAWVDSTFTGKPLPQALEAATADALEVLTELTPAQVKTHVGTAVSSIDRAVTAQLATEDDSVVYLYIGPLDDIVRKSCQWIVSKWATKEQIARLDNGQISNVLITGGGWNCRHSWAPIRRTIAESRGLAQVSNSDIANFNAGSKRTFALRSVRTT